VWGVRGRCGGTLNTLLFILHTTYTHTYHRLEDLREVAALVGQQLLCVCIEYIGVVSVVRQYMVYNCVNYCDTWRALLRCSTSCARIMRRTTRIRSGFEYMGV
jgi:hypothetical protein